MSLLKGRNKFKLVEARNVKYTAHTILRRPLESILYNLRFEFVFVLSSAGFLDLICASQIH